MRVAPEGWDYVSDYCIKRNGYTICIVSGEYELWRGREQLHVHIASTQDALRLWEHAATTTSTS